MMPNPFESIEERLAMIQAQLSNLTLSQTVSPDAEAILSADEAACFLGISKSTLYDNIQRLPHQKKFGKLYFFRSQLLAYLKGESAETSKSSSVRQTRRTRKKESVA